MKRRNTFSLLVLGIILLAGIYETNAEFAFYRTSKQGRGFTGVPVYQFAYDLKGGRDTGYAGKLLDKDNFIVTGASTDVVNGTGINFFALNVIPSTGARNPQFGNNGVAILDSGNINGSSRTDVATAVTFLQNPKRIAVLGESVVSKIGSPTNLHFAIAMVDLKGNLVTSFGNNGWGLYDIESGVNDEIFFGDTDANNDMIVGGFANPTAIVGAGPAFNCALLKVNQYGQRVTSFGQNGQVIIDFNGWDERCRAGLPVYDKKGRFAKYLIGGRSKPAPPVNATLSTPDQTNFRATMTYVNADGTFDTMFGNYEFGFGRMAINANNGSFETIKTIAIGNDIIALGNWGGWDNGISGNKAIGLLRWKDDGSLVKSWANGGISAILPPAAGGSYDVYSLVQYDKYIYVVGGIKATAAAASLPQGIIARFLVKDGSVDKSFGLDGVFRAPLIENTTSALFKSAFLEKNELYLVGDSTKAPSTSVDYDVLVAKYLL